MEKRANCRNPFLEWTSAQAAADPQTYATVLKSSLACHHRGNRVLRKGTSSPDPRSEQNDTFLSASPWCVGMGGSHSIIALFFIYAEKRTGCRNLFTEWRSAQAAVDLQRHVACFLKSTIHLHAHVFTGLGVFFVRARRFLRPPRAAS